MKENHILHPKNRVVFYSFLVWIQTIVLFIIGLFILTRLNTQLQIVQKVFSALLLFDVGLGVLAFIIMCFSALFRVFGKKIILLIPVLLLIVAYFVVIFPRANKKESKYIPKQYYYTLVSSELKIGSTGTEVQILQSALSTKKYISKNLITGYYGEQTKKAVESFQSASKLAISGIMDENTRKAFNASFGKDNDSNYYLSLIPTTIAFQNSSNNSSNTNSSGEWGKSERVEGTDHGWTMKVGNDPVMGTAQETFDALNIYRSKKGVHGLNWDGNLGSYAQQRAADLVANGGVDDHRGFREHIGNTENRKRLGFYGLGENASCGFRLTGTHIIEWLFAGDPPHENNQLNSNWSDVGIGISNTCITLIFGYDRMN
jgi:uncharacterized protein YkwD